MASDLPKHAIRDGDYRVIYVVGHKGLYKYFPDANYIAMMKNIDFAGGEVGQMVGYGALTTFPPAGGVRILIPTTIAAIPGGLWVHTVAKDTTGTNVGTWVLKNGASGPNPLPSGWQWHNVAASPKNGNTIALYGFSVNDGNRPTDWFPSGFVQDTASGKSPLWLTNDGGDNWFECPLPAPKTYASVLPSDGHIDNNEVWLTFNDVNTPILFCKFVGLTGACMWWGDPVALKVRSTMFDGTDTLPDSSGFDVPGDNDYYFGTNVDTGFNSMVHGINGEMIATGNFGTHTSDIPPWPGLRVMWVADPLTAPPYPGAHWHERDLALQSLDRMTAPNVAIVGIGSDGGIYYSSDYHTERPSLALARADETLSWQNVVATAEGIVATRADGTYAINDIASGGAPVLAHATRPINLTSSRQGARRIVAGRMSYSGGTGDDTIPSNYLIYDGDSWTTLVGPTDVQGLNAKLSTTAIAVTEG